MSLSQEQEKAIALQENTVIRAGAGSGKTFTLIEAVYHDLVVEKISPRKLGLATFTRSAAKEMRERLEKLLVERKSDLDIRDLWIGTIDSLCSRFLKENALQAGISPSFTLAEGRQLKIIREQALSLVSEELDDDSAEALMIITGDSLLGPKTRDFLFYLYQKGDLFPPSSSFYPAKEEVIQAFEKCLQEDITAKRRDNILADLQCVKDGDYKNLSSASWGFSEKNTPESVKQALQKRNEWRLGRISEKFLFFKEAIFRAHNLFSVYYDKLKKEKDVLEFVDLPKKVLLAQKKIAPFLDKLYVDEAQDTSPIQFSVLKGLVKGPMICVGDVNQSIYGWREGDVENFLKETQGFQEVDLKDNYRSYQDILEVVHNISSQQKGIHDLHYMNSKISNKPTSDPLEFVFFENKEDDASILASQIEEEIEKGVSLENICVLTFTNAQINDYAQALRKRGIATLALQNKGLLSQDECLDIHAYLGLIDNEENEGALIRVLSSAWVSLSDSELFYLFEKKRDKDITLEEACNPSFWEGNMKDKLTDFCVNLEKVRKKKDAVSVYALLEYAQEVHSFDFSLQLLDETGGKRRNVKKLLLEIKDLEDNYFGPQISLIYDKLEEERLEGDALGTDEDDPSLPGVRIMTIHNAKGGEWNICYLTQLNSRQAYNRNRALILDKEIGISFDSLKDNVAEEYLQKEEAKRMEENQRVLYVALTRAKKKLVIFTSLGFTKQGVLKGLPVFKEAFSFLDKDVIYKQEIQVGKVSIPVKYLQKSESPDYQKEIKVEEVSNMPFLKPRLLPIVQKKLSYTQLVNYKKCSYRRYLQHDLALRPWQNYHQEKEKMPSNNLAFPSQRKFGQEFHKVVETCQLKDLKKARQLALKFSDPQKAEEYLSQIESDSYLQEILSQEEIRREEKFSYPLGDLIIQGIIDFSLHQKEEAFFLDWKTGDEIDLKEDYLLQRKLYALAFLKAGYKKVKSVIYDFSENKEVEYSQADLENLEKEVQKEIEIILNEVPSPASNKEEYFCENCPGRERLCPVSFSLGKNS